MKVYIWWNGSEAEVLHAQVKLSLDELGLVDFIELLSTEDEALKNELHIKSSPALVIEEESINFKDVIFEGMIPEAEEIKAMFLSIIWGWSWGGCGSKWSDGSCGSWCSC